MKREGVCMHNNANQNARHVLEKKKKSTNVCGAFIFATSEATSLYGSEHKSSPTKPVFAVDAHENSTVRPQVSPHSFLAVQVLISFFPHPLHI